VGGEHHGGSDSISGLVEASTIADDGAVEQFEHEEPGMTFVEVVYLWLPTHCIGGASAANAEHHLLFDAMASIT
jgi:hypothetical protein